MLKVVLANLTPAEMYISAAVCKQWKDVVDFLDVEKMVDEFWVDVDFAVHKMHTLHVRYSLQILI